MVATSKTSLRRRRAQEAETNPSSSAATVLTPVEATPSGNGTSAVQALGSVTQVLAEPAAPAFAPIGVLRLDELLGGGLPKGSSVLAYGAPYSGKGTLQRLFFLEGVHAGIPSVFVLTDTDSTEMSSRLRGAEPGFEAQEKAGLVTYIDAYSNSTGATDAHPNARYLDTPQNLDGLLELISAVAAEAQAHPAKEFRLAIQSVSTLLVEAGPSRVFKFLRALTGRLRRTNGTALLLLEAGMHPESDVQAMKHLSAGMVHTREVDEKYFLRVEGLRTVYQPGWVEYAFNATDFDLTGSFASERIRSTALGS